jgi:hypothetical protein
VRVVAYIRRGTIRLVWRNDLDVSVGYPEVLEPPSTNRHRSLALVRLQLQPSPGHVIGCWLDEKPDA